MSGKRGLVNLEDVSAVCTSSPNVTVGGILTSVSLMKKSKTSDFFEGSISDGKSSMTLFGFDSKVQKRLADHMQEAIVLGKCEVKNSKIRSDELELYVSPKTDFAVSPRKYNITETESDADPLKEISLVDISNMDTYQRVTITVKVASIDSPSEVRGGKRKQDIIVADTTSVARFTVWENNINTLQPRKSYKLTNVVVREFNGTKYLSTAFENSTVEEVADIGQVLDPSEDATAHLIGIIETHENVRIVGVVSFEKHYKCLKCLSRVVVSDNTDIGKCIKCTKQQSLDVCESALNARLMIKSTELNQPIFTLTAYGDVLKDIIADQSIITATTLLKAPSFTVNFKNDIICSITRN